MPDRSYSAITIWQPWATLIAEGAKPFEFRSWPAPRRLWGQRVAIHAGARPAVKNEIRDLLLRLHSSHWRETGLLREPAIRVLEPTLLAPRRLPLAAIVCLATLGEPLRDAALAAQLGTKVNDSDRDEHTNWGWPLGAIEPLRPPVPARGAQGWWTWRHEDA